VKSARHADPQHRSQPDGHVELSRRCERRQRVGHGRGGRIRSERRRGRGTDGQYATGIRVARLSRIVVEHAEAPFGQSGGSDRRRGESAIYKCKRAGRPRAKPVLLTAESAALNGPPRVIPLAHSPIGPACWRDSERSIPPSQRCSSTPPIRHEAARCASGRSVIPVLGHLRAIPRRLSALTCGRRTGCPRSGRSDARRSKDPAMGLAAAHLGSLAIGLPEPVCRRMRGSAYWCSDRADA
jgi:hypothetical protein